jgi:Ca2+/H+ antiporter
MALGAGVFIAALVASDGESNWLDWFSLIAVYGHPGSAFFLVKCWVRLDTH